MDDEWMLYEANGLEEHTELYRSGARFEDLIAWQRARELTAAIYALTRASIARRDRSLCEQMQRAAVSIMSNIAEGYERGSTREYHHFLSIAKGSCGELRAQLYVALDAGYIDQPTFDHHLQQAERVSQLVAALRSSIARRLARETGKSGNG